MRVHWLQHAEHEGLGSIDAWLRARRFTVTCSQLQRREPLPAARDFDWLIVMGGPMNIYEHDLHPWLVPEKKLIRDACVTNKKVLGICLGSQLIADVLGGSVTKNHEAEIGWFDVTLTDKAAGSGVFDDFPGRFEAFHWHGDTFEVPPGSEVVMSSEACPRQAFTWGEGLVVGIQFHLEVRHADAQAWLREDPPVPSRYVQAPGEILRDPQRFAMNNRLMSALLDRAAAV
jgi:GMP synthase-like glutamine amidotransferase